MTIEDWENHWRHLRRIAAVDVSYAGIATDVATAAHCTPRTAGEEVGESGEDVAFVIVNMDEASFRDFIDFQSSVDKYRAAYRLDLCYQVNKGATIGVPHKDVIWLYETPEGFCYPFIEPRNQSD